MKLRQRLLLSAKRRRFHWGPTRVLATGFACVILLGGLLLHMPFATHPGPRVSLLEALFTSTSAVCVTGLTVVETGAAFNNLGQLIILGLIQIGGLGFMTMATMIMVLMGRRVSLKSRLVIQESMHVEGIAGLVRTIRWVVLLTFALEFAGALLLATRWVPQLGWKTGIWYSVFHAISAFCNAGFDIFGKGDSLTAYANDPVITLTICLLITLGGMGFLVIRDVAKNWRKPRQFSLHTKVVLTMTGALLLVGAVAIYLMEAGNALTLGAQSIQPWARPLQALMQSVTVRTAGFFMIPQNGMRDATKLLCVILMFIGASPASTGGGIKTTTGAVALAVVYSVVRGSTEVHFFGRKLPVQVAMRALAIFIVSLLALLGLTMLMTMVEKPQMVAEPNFMNILFETTSAMATVGLSSLGTATLSTTSRLVIMLLMFMGRVGPLTLTLALAHRLSGGKQAIHFPEGHIMIG